MEKNKISIILIGLFLIIGCAGMQQINEAIDSAFVFERIENVEMDKKTSFPTR